MKLIKILKYLHPVLILLIVVAVCHFRTQSAIDQSASELKNNERALNSKADQPILPEETQIKIREITCPEGMAVILGGQLQLPPPEDDEKHLPVFETVETFCMDVYEYPNKKYEVPLTGLTFIDAQKICVSEGKRLCTEDEWLFACAGPESRPYSYSRIFQPWRCNTDGVYAGDCAKIGPSGSHPGCHNEYGVFDLNGNVSEWVTSREGMQDQYAVMGGAAWPADYGQSCYSRHTHSLEDSAKYGDDGFRCCAKAR